MRIHPVSGLGQVFFILIDLYSTYQLKPFDILIQFMLHAAEQVQFCPAFFALEIHSAVHRYAILEPAVRAAGVA